MNPVLIILVLLITVLLWAITRPLWKPFGEWLYYRVDSIDKTLNEEHEIVMDIKGEDNNERTRNNEKKD